MIGGGSAGGGTTIDSLWVALGIDASGVQAGLGKVRGAVNDAKGSLLSVGTAIKAFVAGFAVKEIADIGSTFEQNRIQIAGFLSALGQSSDFNQGLVDAQGVIQQITKDAAILPGEAQEYIDVFKAGLPFVQGAMPGGSLGDITAFTNKLTAIGKTFGLGADVIAREFDHMLSPGKGMASLRLPLFRQLLSFMPKLQNGARVTAESFNAMSAPQRLALLQATFEKLQPMLDASANSFDAMWGAAVSALKQMTRVATAPLFKGMKQALDQVNSALYDNAGKLTPFGQNIVDGITTAMKYLTQMLTMGGHLIMWFAQSKAGALTFKVAIGLLGAALAGLAIEKTVGSFARLLSVMTNMSSLFRGAFVTALGLIAEDLYQFYTGGDSVTGLLVQKLGPALTIVIVAVTSLIALMGALKAVALASALRMAASWAIAFWPVTLAIAAVAALAFGIYELKQHWSEVFDWIGKKWDWVIEKVNAAKEALGISTDYQGAGAADGATTDPMTGAVIPASGGAPWAPADGAGGGGAWTPAAAAGTVVGAGAAGAGNNTTNHNTFNIKSTDPVQAGNEVSRALTRNAQTAVKY
ncbi:MAG TPA: hypothetical protein VLT58_09730 [Polyangia bacterium]|nr:hypothetical protein [Polyangia bacterium]